MKLIIILWIISCCKAYSRNIIFLDGAQGSGKTYLSYKLPQFIEIAGVRHNLIIVSEPYDKWQVSGALAILKSNITHYNIDFQMYIMASLVRRTYKL